MSASAPASSASTPGVRRAINEAGSGLIGTETALAIIPTGSGNGLARHLKIPLQLERAVKLLNEHSILSMDTGRMNEYLFLATCGVGFDAHISRKFAEFGKRGFISYIRLVSREYNAYRPERYTLRIDGKEYEREALMITVANASQYGNNATIAPGAVVDDGIFEVCILKKAPLVELPGIVLRVFTNRIDRSRYSEVITGKEIEIIQKGMIAHTDGEPLDSGPQLRISVVPTSLNVVVP